MKARYLTNCLLLLLVISLIWFSQQLDKPATAYSRLIELDKNTLSSIMIRQPNSDAIRIEKQDDNWHIVSPFNALANKARIQLILNIIDMPSYRQFEVHHDDDLGRFGINEQSIQLQLNNYQIQFGGIEKISKHRYVLFNTTLHLITDNHLPLLKVSANNFIDNKLIATSLKLNKISLPALNNLSNNTKDNIVIELSNGHWLSQQSQMTSDELTLLITRWQHLYANQVRRSENQKLDKTAHQTVTLWFEGQTHPQQFNLTVKDTLFSLHNQQTRLTYYFPTAQLTQLLPTK